MRFGPVPADEAVGGILAYAMETAAGRIAKGTVLTAAHVADLRTAGHDQVTIARLGVEDVAEDEAAAQLASALVPDPDTVGLRLTAARTGRVNIYAEGPGILKMDADAVHAVNRVDPMLTVATLPPLTRVTAGTMIATVKVISYGVATKALNAALSAAAGAIGLHRPMLRHAVLIETTTGSEEPSPKGRAALATRLERLEMTLGSRQIAAHSAAALMTALGTAEADLICVLTASATSDIADVAPAAVVAAGGSVTHFGMPVDPGNLLFLGELKGVSVVGLPGCARSPALNGADWVLERIICGVPVTGNDIAAMGVGGLLKDIPTRPLPRREIDRKTP